MSTQPSSPAKSWQARISEATDAIAQAFVESVSYDWRLYKQDVAGSICHAHMLSAVGLLPDEDRRRMLADHGKMARGYPDVRANTVASFSLGDYEWLLAFEADELYRIVDLMRHLRASEARMHVREEVPFYTGRRKSVADLVAGLA